MFKSIVAEQEQKSPLAIVDYLEKHFKEKDKAKQYTDDEIFLMSSNNQ